MPEHSAITGADAIHPNAYYQSSDPGAVGAGKYWWDSTTTPPIYKKRNAGDTDWDVVMNPSPYLTGTSLVHYSTLR